MEEKNEDANAGDTERPGMASRRVKLQRPRPGHRVQSLSSGDMAAGSRARITREIERQNR